MTFRWVAVGAAVLQLIGTWLIVWGLKLTSDMGISDEVGGRVIHYAGIVREHPRALTWGIRLLLLGLALQVVAAVL